MNLKPMEILGVIAGFIPGVSTIAGIIKAVIYYRRSHGSAADRAKMEETGEKVAKVAQKNIMDLDAKERKINNELFLLSLFETIPIINIAFAFFETGTLSRLADVRSLEEKPEKQTDLLFGKYRIQPIKDEKKKEYMSNVLITLHNLNLKGVRLGYVSKKDYHLFFPWHLVRKLYSTIFKSITTYPDLMQEADSSWYVKETLSDFCREMRTQIDSREKKLDQLHTGLIDQEKDKKKEDFQRMTNALKESLKEVEKALGSL